MSKFQHLKPLPDLITKNIQLETGFYSTEVVALQNGWRLIKRSLINHSTKITINFFSENFLLLERFRDVETQKFYLTSLHQHSLHIMNVYGCLIESGLNNVAFIRMILNELKNKHKLYGIGLDDIKLISDYIKQYLLDLLDKVKSSTFINGLNKLSELIIDYHKEETAARAEEEADSLSDESNY